MVIVTKLFNRCGKGGSCPARHFPRGELTGGADVRTSTTLVEFVLQNRLKRVQRRVKVWWDR